MYKFNTIPIYKTFCHLFVIKYDRMADCVKFIEKITQICPILCLNTEGYIFQLSYDFL